MFNKVEYKHTPNIRKKNNITRHKSECYIYVYGTFCSISKSFIFPAENIIYYLRRLSMVLANNDFLGGYHIILACLYIYILAGCLS